MIKLLHSIRAKVNFKSLFFKVLTANIVLMLISTSIVIFNNISMRGVMEKEIVQINNNYLEKVISSVTDSLKVKDIVLAKYIYDADVNYVSTNSRINGEIMIRFLRLKDSISNLKNSMPVIEDIWIYFKKMNIVLTKDGTFVVGEKYANIVKTNLPLDKTYRIMDSALFTDIKENVSIQRPKAEPAVPGSMSPAFLYNMGIYNKNLSLMVKIEKSYLEESLNKLGNKDGTIIFLLDQTNGAIITNNRMFSGNSASRESLCNKIRGKSVLSGGKISYQGLEYIVAYRDIPADEMTYIVMFPMTEIDRRIAEINKNSIAILAIVLVCSILTIMITEKTVGLPFRRLINDIKRQSSDSLAERNEIDIIRGTINKINEGNENYRKILTGQKDLLEEVYLNRLASNLKIDIDKQIINELGDKYSRYIVTAFIIECREADEEERIKEELLKKLRGLYKLNIVFCSMKEILVLVNINDEDGYLRDLNLAINSDKDTTAYIICGVSNVFKDIGTIRTACEESRDAIMYRRTHDNKIVYGIGDVRMDTEKEKKLLEISVDEESLLVKNVFNGNIEYVEAFFGSNKLLNNGGAFAYKRDTYANLYRLVGLIMLNKEIKLKTLLDAAGLLQELKINETYDIRVIEDYVRRIFLALTEKIRNGIIEYNSRMVIDFVDTNYNKAISLDLLAEKLGVSTVYASKYFKKVTGENFINYVNRHRVIKAKELLENSNKSLNEIYTDTGFQDIKYFIRVFTKYEGITPGNYRKTHRSSSAPIIRHKKTTTDR